jgi:hypothetical protein
MKAIVYRGRRQVTVEKVVDARIEASTDAPLRVTSCALCGSDLHMYDGRAGAQPGLVLGHEPLGIVEDVGADVLSVQPSDRVVVPTHIFCGFCANCMRGYTAACLTVNPRHAGAAYGYAGKGPYRANPAQENPRQVIDDLCRLISPTGSLGIAGVYEEHDPGGTGEEARTGRLAIPWGTLTRGLAGRS